MIGLLRLLCLPLLCIHGFLCDNDNSLVEFSFFSNQTCSGSHVKGTLSAIADCMPRLRVLRLPLPNGIELTEMTPTHVEVSRCGGGCHSHRQSCVARLIRSKAVPVIVAKCGISVGLCDKECASVEVEEHLECGCECGVRPQDCSPGQRLHKERCMCECKDREEMRSCQETGRIWNQDSCTCQCGPVSRMEQCSPGLVFDNNTCTCVPFLESKNELSKEKSQESNEDGFIFPWAPWENIIIGVLISILILFILLNISLVRNLRCLHNKVKNAQTTIYSTINKANFGTHTDPYLLDTEPNEDDNSVSSYSTYSRRIDFDSGQKYKSFLKLPRSDELPSLDSEGYIISALETLPEPPQKDCRDRKLSTFK